MDKPRPMKTIAFLSSSPGGRSTLEKWAMWRGVADAAREEGVNLIYVAGEQFESAPEAVLYRLLGAHNVDGIISWNAFVTPDSSSEKSKEFLESFAPLPVVSVELESSSCANILVDNDQGMQDLLLHLINQHGYRRIAFATRPSSHASQLRQAAFERRMGEYGLLDPRLIGTLEELEERGLLNRQGCDAIMAYSDRLGVEVVDRLGQLGLRVPEDMVVTGFNDGQEARGCLPPLTTVRLPFQNMGRKAVDLLMKRVRGEDCNGDIILTPYLILRRSCGCLEPMAERAALGPFTRGSDSLETSMTAARPELIEKMSGKMGTSIESLARAWAVELVDIFSKELYEHLHGLDWQIPSNRFLADLSALLRRANDQGSNVSRWHEALTLLRQALLPALQGNAGWFVEDLFQQARVLVGQVAVRAEIHHTWQAAQRTEILHDLESNLVTAASFEEMLSILTRGLERLNLGDFFLALYENPAEVKGKARLGLVYQQGKRVPVDTEDAFLATELLPAKWLMTETPDSLMMEALSLPEEPLGYIIFRTAPPADALACDIFGAIRIQLSSALKSVRLRQKLQDALQEAEEANQSKSRFLSMVSHELRTPLNLIVGLSEMALRQQSRDKQEGITSPAVTGKFLDQIYVSGQHLDRLIRDVLDLASSQVGQMTLSLKPLDLLAVLQDVSGMGEHLAQQKNLAFRMEAPDTLPRVDGDKTRLRQVLLNLLSNAVKFTAHGEVALKAVLEGNEILISVSDTGLGIEKADQDKIFDEFQQSDRSVARGYGGIGLGLAITRRLVEMHGGRIWVTSSGAEGSGSTFSFTLPILPPDADMEAPEDRAARLRAEFVLIVTNVAGGSQKLSDHLSGHGFQVQELALQDTPDLIGNLMSAPPGAIVLDFAPASEQGWEVVKRVKDNPNTQDIPVLFYSLLQNEQTGSLLEMDYLSKPVGASELVQALTRHGLGKARHGEKHTILIIDDERDVLDLHARIVRAELPHCAILTARNGVEGMHIMHHKAPDLVLLDLMMPELDGFGVLKAMQAEDALRNVPVIVLSGQALTRSDMERLNQGVATVLSKGVFRSSEIMARIENALARNKRLGGEAQRLVQQAIAYIHENYKEPISRADIASHLCMNEQYLSRCFNKEMGIGPMVYLSRYRIGRAKRLLEAGSLSITQVAMEVGMSSQSYFSRVFQEETGVTPSAYQRGARPAVEPHGGTIPSKE